MANLSSRVEGKLTEIPVRVGQRVSRGELLARLDGRERKAALQMGEATLKAAQGAAATAGAALVSARQRAARRSGTFAAGGREIPLVSGEEANEAKLEIVSASGRAVTAAGQVAEQRAKVEQLRLALEGAELRAPFDGVVTGVYFEPEMNVKGGETVVRVVGEGRSLRVRFAVPEEMRDVLGGLHLVRVELDDHTALSATVDRVAPEVELSSRTYFVEGNVDAAGSGPAPLFAGRTVRVVTPASATH
jgi:RND family efflux transporter MFP subunit